MAWIRKIWPAIVLCCYCLIVAGGEATSSYSPGRSQQLNVQVGALPNLQDAASLNDRASALMHAGNYDKALGLKQSVLRIMQQKLGAEEQDTVPVLLDLAICQIAEGDNASAEAAFKQAMAIEERAGKGKSEEAGRVLERYSCLLRRMGNSTQAQSYEERSSDILFTKGPPSGPITGRVVNGKLIMAPQPGYPAEARKRKTAGSVDVLITISEEGRILDACAVSGPPVFAAFAEDAALHALYTPTTLAGSPVKVGGSVIYNFKK